jgi:hypothetical protein
MATLAPYNSRPYPLPGDAPSPGPGYITYSKSEPEFHDSSLDHDATPLNGRGIRRSGSPTPSEREELKQYDGFLKKAFRKESYKDKRFVGMYCLHSSNFRFLWSLVTVVVVIILIIITILLSVFHKQIVKALLPAAKWVKAAPAGWLIPIALLIVLSIPPVSISWFGHS